MTIDELKNSIIDLYQHIKIRKESDANLIDSAYLEEEKISLLSISPLVLIEHIKTHLNILINIKVNERLSQLKENPIEFVSLYGSEIPANDYEKLLRRYEGDIRNYIKLVNMLKIHIDELNERQEILEKQIEQLQKEANLVPTSQSIEYKKKIEELTTLIKTYEKHNLKIPLLEKKIKIQKIELNKLDSFYKKKIKSYTKKIEDYEKGIYLNKNSNIIKKAKNIKSNFNTSTYFKKSKNRINSNSSKRENNSRNGELKTIENKQNINHMKKTNSISNIFFKLKNYEIKRKIEENIKSNIKKNIISNLHNNINGNGGNYEDTNKDKNENTVFSQKLEEKKKIDSYYDSIETDDNDNKTINVIGVISSFRKKINLKSNNINKILIENKEKNNYKKIQTRSISKKTLKRPNNNRSSLKIPKKFPDHINTSKYIKTKEKNIPKFYRYSSLKQIDNGKIKLNINLKKDNDQFNKTFSKIPGVNNTNISTGITNNNNNNSSNNNNKNINKSYRNTVKNFILNKINKKIIINGRTPIPVQRTQSKTCSFIK